MTVHVALLRAVNLGSHGKVAMAELRRLAEDLGLASPRTLLQSGNLVFESTAYANAAALETALEAAAAKELSLRTEFFVRTAKEWAALVDANPFPDEATSDPGHLVVLLTKERPEKKKVAMLADAIEGPEVVRPGARHLYAIYPAGIGRSKLTNVFIERHIGGRVTGRNWNTVLKLASLAGGG